MHIPDGMISPSTALVALGAMTPAWWFSGVKLRTALGPKQIPLLAVCAAFSFTIMMFNVPALGGTTAHALGSTLVAILLGPWAAVLAVTAALAIQALFFADGGLLAIGANSFTMAFVAPLLGYSAYRLLRRHAPATSGQTILASGFGGYVGVFAASTVVAVILGLQPSMFHDVAGKALYFPFGLKVTLAGIVPTHLLIVGPIEAVVTAVAVRFAVANGVVPYGSDPLEAALTPRWHRFAVILLALLALSPLGLLAKGEAWGEWDRAGVEQRAGYAPQGIVEQERHSWRGLGGLADYGSDRGPAFYVLSGLIGVAALGSLAWFVSRRLARGEEPPPPPPPGDPPCSGHGGELPGWLSAPGEEPPPPGSVRRSSRFMEHTIEGISESAQATVFGERWARTPGALQRVDASAKVIGHVGLIVAAGWVRDARALAAFFVVSLVLASLAKLPWGLFLKRAWLTMPLWVALVAWPAALNVVTPGPAVLTVSHQPYLAVTGPGIEVVGLLLARVGLALSFALLLTLTTRWHELLAALRALGLPKLFLVVLTMTYRYVLLLLRVAQEMVVARRSRTVGVLPNREGRRFVGRSIGALFGRSMRLVEDVHAAMVARGFTGEIPAGRRRRWRWSDGAYAGVLVLTAVGAVWLVSP